MSRINHRIFLTIVLSFVFFFSFFQTSQAGFFDWFRWFKKSDSQNTTEVILNVKKTSSSSSFQVQKTSSSSKSSMSLSSSSLSVDSTKDWKIYRNEEYGFEFKYPIGWNATLNLNYTEGTNYKVIARVVNPARAGKPDTDAPIEMFLIRSLNYPCNGATTNLTGKAGTDTGWDKGFGNIDYRDLCIKTDGWPITISLSAYDQPSQVIMERILSTFKFIESSTSSSSSSSSKSSISSVQLSVKKEEILIPHPKITKYKNKRYGIEIALPEGIVYSGSFFPTKDKISETVEFFNQGKGSKGNETTRLKISNSQYENILRLKDDLDQGCLSFTDKKCASSLIDINGITAISIMGKEKGSIYWINGGLLYIIRGPKYDVNGFGVDWLISNIKLSTPDSSDIDYIRNTDISQMQVVLELFFDKNRTYPTNLSELSSLYDVPLEPKSKKPYYYLPIKANAPSGTFYSYQLGASFEEPLQYLTKLKFFKNTGCNGEVGKYCYILEP